jgi:hypothetical protein
MESKKVDLIGFEMVITKAWTDCEVGCEAGEMLVKV